ncbi:MAG: hypothetical protein JW709_08190 [Sedimentisphaerales bacterium]|nr:hypothetical protein [Sedimentisphaerales bacterium]
MNTLNEDKFREISPTERALIRCLLSINFKGRDNIKHQLDSALVRRIDDDGSLEFKIVDVIPADVSQRVPVECWCKDIDGMQIEILLHVVNGIVNELEIFRGDGGTIQLKFDTLKEVTVFSPDVHDLLHCPYEIK